MAFERLRSITKKFITKRVDANAWNLGPDKISGIRMLTDPENPAIILGIATVAFDPQSSAPLTPSSPAGEVDPHINIGGPGGVQLPYTATLLTGLTIITLNAQLTTTQEIQTLEAPVGTDYSVPASKKIILFKLVIMSGVANIGVGIGHGSDGVAPGNTKPTDPIDVIGENALGATQKGPYTNPVADTTSEFDIHAEIATGRFPYAHAVATSSDKDIIVYGAEVDA